MTIPPANAGADGVKEPPPPTSWSRSVHETTNGSHRFEISGYSLAKGMGNGRYIASESFAVGGHEWAVHFYPDGKSPEDAGTYVSVFVALASDEVDVRALFEITLIDQSDKGKHKVHSHFVRALDAGPYTLKYRGSMWGYKRFYKRSSLETSDYLKNDRLIINCTVGVVKQRLETPKNYSITVPPSDLGQCLKEFLNLGVACDISFVVGEENFGAHKKILAARSPVFKAQFYGPIGNPNLDRVVVEDVEPIVFKAMLQYIYSDELPDVCELAGSVSLYTSAIVIQHLLAAADRFGLDRLKVLCESKLCEKVTAETVATTLALAEQHHCTQLKSVCLKFTVAQPNLGAVMQTDGYKYLEESCPSLLSDLLATVINVENGPGTVSRKRGVTSTLGLDTVAAGDVGDERCTRRRM